MNRVATVVALVLLLAAGMAWWQAPMEEPAAAAAAAGDAPGKTSPGGDTGRVNTPESGKVAEDAPGDGDGEPARPESPPQGDAPPRPRPEAVASLRRARQEGESRTPPLAQDTPEREQPTAEELADPDMYLEYEARQKQQVFTSFLEASEKKVSELQSAIERAEAEGMAEERLAEGREKLERLRAMREQVLRDHPELADSPGATPAGEESAPQEEDGSP